MNKKPKAIAVFGADTHISEAVWSQRPRLRGDSFFGLSQLVDLALAESVPLVLAGDCLELLDANGLTSQTLQFVVNQIERLRVANLPLYYISGQHDMASPSWLSSMNSWATDVSGRTFTLGDKLWYGLDFQEAPALQAAMSLRPSSFGLLLHQRWAELSGGRGHQGELRSITNARVVVTGDMHSKVYKQIGKLHVFSPGATHKRRVDEPDRHYAVIGYDNGEFRFRKLKARVTVRISIDPLHNVRRQLDKIVQQVRVLIDSAENRAMPPELQQPFVIFDAGGHYEQAYSRLGEDLMDSAHVFTRGKRKTADSVEAIQTPNQPSGEQRKQHLASVFEAVVNTEVSDILVRDILLRAHRGEPLGDTEHDVSAQSTSL